MDSASGLNALKTILFEEENQKFVAISEKLKDLNIKIEDSLHNREIPDEELQEILSYLMNVMPEKLGPAITKTLKIQIRESRDEVVQVLYPIIGQMIKKFIQKEMEVLTEKIDKQLENAFSIDQLILRIKAMITGVKYSELVLKESKKPEVLQVFIIEEGSGIMLANYSRSQTIDKDMIAGMLTAIKSFVTDAFETKDQSLETIEYELYKIYIQHFNKFYMAVVLSGVMDAGFKSKLDDSILKFVKEHTLVAAGIDEAGMSKISKELEKEFNKIN